MKPNRRNPLFANIFRANTLTTAVVVSLVSFAATHSAMAADAYWDTNGTDPGAGTNPGTWGTSAFWNATADGTTTTPGAWTANNVAIFSAGTDATGSFNVPILTATTQTINGLTVQEGSPTIAGPGKLALGLANTPISIANHTTISAAIDGGTNGLTLSGAATNDKILTLSGANTFTGGVTISNGILKITKTASPGVGTKTITITNGTAGNPSLQLDGSGAAIVLPNTITYRTSNIGSNGAIRNLLGDNTLAGKITLTSGGGDSHIYSDAGSLVLSGGVTADQSSRGLVLRGASIGANTVSGVIDNTNTPNVKKNDGGLWILTATNTYQGGTTVSAGTLRGTVAGAFGAGGNLTLAGGTLDLYNTGGTTFGRNTIVTGNATILTSRAATAGAGVTHTLGTLSIGAQTLTLTPVTANSGTQGLTFLTTTFTASPTFYVTNITNVTGQLNLGAISGGSNGLTKTGPGLLALTAANTFSGPVDLLGGTLRLQNASALGTVYDRVVNVATSTTGGSGTTLDIAAGTTITGPTVILNSDAGDYRSTLTASSGNSVFNGDLLVSGPSLTQVSAGTGASLTINGPVISSDGAGAGTLFTRGAGIVTYNGVLNMGVDRIFSHTESGTVIVNSTGNSWLRTQVADGQIQLGTNNALPNVDFTFGQNATGTGRLELNGFSQSVKRLNSWATSTATAHVLRNSNTASASTLTFATPVSITDTIKNLDMYGAAAGLGALNLVSNGLGRTEILDGTPAADAWTVNSGTLAFTGTSNRLLPGSVTAASGAIIEKSGTGALTAVSTWDNAGTTDVLGGSLILGAGTAGAINVGDGATLGSGFGGGALSATSLTFGVSGTTTFAPILGAPSFVAKVAANTVTPNGVGAVSVVPQGSITVGTYALIDYTTLAGDGFPGFALGPVGSYPHGTFSLYHNTGAGRIDLIVDAVDSLVWTGADALNGGLWDTNTTQNFKIAPAGSATGFYTGDAVLFDDSGANTTIITGLATTTGALTFTNTTAGFGYNISVPLTVAGNISKSGDGALTLSGANVVNGNINISNGTNTLSGANVVNGNLAISGGTTTLSGANTLNGDVTITDTTATGGTLKLGNANALRGAASVTVSDGGTIDANGSGQGQKYAQLTISGTGAFAAGAVVNTGAGITNNNHFATITLAGDASWGGTGRYDIADTTVLYGAGKTLTKIGSNELWFNPKAGGSPLGGVIVDGGTLGVQTNNILPTGFIVTVNTGAFHSIYNSAVQHDVLLNDNGTLQSVNGTSTMNGTVTLAGSADTIRFMGGGSTLDIAGKITGATGIGFTKNGTGSMNIISTTSDYTGDTRVLAGNLNMSTTGLLPVATNLIMDGGQFDIWNRNITVGSISGTLDNNARIYTGTAGLWKLTTTQSTTTETNTRVGNVIIEMSGTGSLTLGGTVDNSGGLAIVNSGTLVFAKGNVTPVTQSVHACGSGTVIVNGGTLRLAGSYNNTTAGTGVNTPPAGIDTTTYSDQLYNNASLALNGGTFDLNGHQEAINGLSGAVGATISNSSTTAAKLYVGHQNAGGTMAGSINNGAGTGTMALEKIGTGTLTLSGTSNFTGGLTQTLGNTIMTSTGVLGATPITVTTGTFTLDGTHGAGAITLTAGTFKGAGTSSGTVTAAAGSTIGVGEITSGTSTATLTLGGLSLAGSTINLDFNPAGPALDKIATTSTGGLTLNGTNTLNVALGAAGWVTGKYPVLTYVGALGGTGGLAALTVPPVGHGTVTLVDDGPGTISLDVVAGALNNWVGGASSAWDYTALNWNSTDNLFKDGDAVVFDDSATTFAPAIAANVKPAGVTFNNTTDKPYTLSGSATAGIIGTTGLLKKNTGEATLAGINNTYTGATVIENGTLIANFNNGTAAAALPAASPVTVGTGTTLKVVANDANITFNNPLTGDGTIIVDPHLTAATAVREVNINSTLTTFTGTIRLTSSTDVASGLGTMRTVSPSTGMTAVGIGAATIIVDPGAQAWLSGNTFTNNFTITGHGFAEGGGGVPVAASGLTAYTGTNKGGIGAIRMENNTVIAGNIKLDGSAKIGAYNTTGTISGSIGTTNPTDVLSIGGGANNNVVLLTGTNNLGPNPLVNVFVNAGATANNNVLGIGNNTTTGTLGTGSVTLNGDGGLGALRFDRSDGYTLALGNTITSSGTNTTNTQLRIETQGSTFNQNSVPINLGNGVVQIGLLRTGVVADLNGTVGAGTISIGNGTLNLTSASAITTGRLVTSDLASAVSTINQPAGTLTITGTDNTNSPTASFLLGNVAGATAATTYNLSGTGVINAAGAELSLGWDSQAGVTFNQSGGIANYRGIDLGNGRNLPATYNLTGGRLNLGASGITKNVTKTMNMGGATVGAFANWSSAQNINVTATSTIDTLDSVDLTTGRTIALSGALSGIGGLAKNGAGTLALSGANTYAGTTTVTAGRLLVNNSSGSGTGPNTVAVASGAALGGTGTISGAATVGGTLEPGSDSVNTLTFGSTLTLSSGSTYAATISGVATNDKVNATGTVTVTGSTIAVTLSGYVPASADVFDLVDASSIFGTPTFDFTAAALLPGLSWDTTDFATNGTIKVTGTAITDPYIGWASSKGVTGGKDGDDDGDGVKNLLEFATNSDAKNAGSGARVYPMMFVIGADNALTFTVAVRKTATFAVGSPDASKQEAIKDNVKYTIEASDELGVWNTVVVTELAPGDAVAVQTALGTKLTVPGLEADWEWHTFRTAGGVVGDPKDFIRLKVNDEP